MSKPEDHPDHPHGGPPGQADKDHPHGGPPGQTGEHPEPPPVVDNTLPEPEAPEPEPKADT